MALLLQTTVDVACRGVWDVLAIDLPTGVSFQTAAAFDIGTKQQTSNAAQARAQLMVASRCQGLWQGDLPTSVVGPEMRARLLQPYKAVSSRLMGQASWGTSVLRSIALCMAERYIFLPLGTSWNLSGCLDPALSSTALRCRSMRRAFPLSALRSFAAT